MCKGINAAWTLTAITTTHLIMFEGSRLWKHRHVSTSIPACTSTQSEQSNGLNQMNLDRHLAAPFIGLAYDVMMTSWHDVISIPL